MTQQNAGERTSEFFHDYAADFSSIYGNEQTALNRFINERFRKSMRYRYEMTLESCQPIDGLSVIDVGCGPGHYGIALAKMGAGRVLGVDFAEGMLKIAAQGAKDAGVASACEYKNADFMDFAAADEMFDYAVVMGFMDYMEDPQKIVDKIMSLTSRRAVFSFPVSSGLLAWQRKLRYKSRCELYLYSREDLERIFSKTDCAKFEIKQIDRDFFVSADK
jgi:2-polyprenyl-3-methyl-5-hydroxy-6-metoxy-1,4-benzoquinol methylase